MAQKLKNIANRTSILYALIAGLWILLSDRFISLLVQDPLILTRLQTYKGLFFVVMTTALLYIFLRTQLHRWERGARERQDALDALAVSNDYLKAVLDSTNDAIFVNEADTMKVIDVNHRMLDMYGYTYEEAVKTPLSQLSKGASPYSDKEITAWRTKTREIGPQTFEWRARHKNGHLFWVEVNMRFVVIGGKNRFVVSVRDISDRKDVENSLKENQRMLSTLMSNLPGIVYRRKNDPDSMMEFVSEGVFALTGYRREDLLGNNNIAFEKLIHPEDRQMVLDEIQNALKSHRIYTLRYRLIDVSSVEKWVWEQGRCVFDDDDQLLFLEGFITDISEQKRAEEELRDVNTRLSVLINAAPDMICFKDGKSRWLEANAADLALFRLTNVDYRGKTDAELADFTDPIYKDAFLNCEQSDEAAWKKGSISRGEEIIPLPEGGHAVYDVIKAPIFDWDGSRKGLIVFGRDITEKKKAEQALYKRLSELEALRTIDRAITSSFDLRITLEILLKQAIHKLSVDAIAILLFDPDLQILKYTASQGFRTADVETAEVRPGQGFAGKIMLERRALRITDAQAIERDKIFTKGESFSTYYGIPLIAKGQMKGILEIFHRTSLSGDLDWTNFIETLSNQTAIAIDNAQMFDTLQHKNLELALAYDATIEGWSRALELGKEETAGHTERIIELTIELAQALGLGKNELIPIRQGVLLHDIGKMGVPDEILLKKGPLTKSERKIMQQHPQNAYDLLSKISYLKQALAIPHYHHEKWDGTGYPEGLRGTQIPLAARIFAVIDVWDALTHDRPYRKAWTQKKVIGYIREQSGKHFDPEIVDLFIRLRKPEGNG